MKGKQEERRELWHQRITEQEKTRQRVRSFCEERGLNENAFCSWRQRFGRSQTGELRVGEDRAERAAGDTDHRCAADQRRSAIDFHR
jgi:Flp pilus assembly protein TadD